MFYLFFLAHLVADFIFQPYWLVQRKRYLSGLAMHCGIVLICMALLCLIDATALALWPAMLGITAVHFVTDWLKVHHGQRIPGPPIVPFLIDQLVHMATLGIALSLMLPAERVWMVYGSSAGQIALIASAYVVAAFATPVAVMVWLDPRFDYLALAGRARIRSFVASVGVVSLMLYSAIFALPAAALGLAIVVRRPRSAHPLDAPFGLLVVVLIAALLGVVSIEALKH